MTCQLFNNLPNKVTVVVISDISKFVYALVTKNITMRSGPHCFDYTFIEASSSQRLIESTYMLKCMIKFIHSDIQSSLVEI